MENAADGQLAYPDSYALEQVLSEFCTRRFVQEFALGRGIVLTNASQQGMAQHLADYLFGHEGLEVIREAAFGGSEGGSLAGFMVQVQDENFDLEGFLDQRRNTVVDQKRHMTLGSLYADGGENGHALYGDVSYTQYTPGRVEFIQGIERSFRYVVYRSHEGLWQVLVDCGKSNDSRIMEDWLKRELRREHDCSIDGVSEENLSSRQTVQFFDDLAAEGLGPLWEFRRVTRLVLRKPTEEFEAEEEHAEVEAPELGGITQAILEGDSLRNNPFVKQCEEGGYRFAAMTCEYAHKERALVAQIRAEFKRRPKVFEVALVSYMRSRGLEAELADEPVDTSQRHYLLATCWRRAKVVHDRLSKC